MANKKHYSTSWQLEPTVRQLATITRLSQELHIPEPTPVPTTRWEANKVIYKLTERRNKSS